MDVRDLDITAEETVRKHKNSSPWETAKGRKGWDGQLLSNVRLSVLIIFQPCIYS